MNNIITRLYILSGVVEIFEDKYFECGDKVTYAFNVIRENLNTSIKELEMLERKISNE